MDNIEFTANELIRRTGYTESKVYYHISPKANRESILKHGLLTNRHPSGYGNKPVYKAIYFYDEKNTKIVHDLIKLFKDFDVFKIMLNEEDTKFMIPDEDAQTKSGTVVHSWEESLEAYHTAAIIKDVPPNKIKFYMNCNDTV